MTALYISTYVLFNSYFEQRSPDTAVHEMLITSFILIGIKSH
jgi:hypothetical protein